MNILLVILLDNRQDQKGKLELPCRILFGQCLVGVPGLLLIFPAEIGFTRQATNLVLSRRNYQPACRTIRSTDKLCTSSHFTRSWINLHCQKKIYYYTYFIVGQTVLNIIRLIKINIIINLKEFMLYKYLEAVKKTAHMTYETRRFNGAFTRAL